jgi:flagellar hook-associated protein 1 FlgK
MGLLDTLFTGASGMKAASAGIDATAQNVANASTVGYQRRTVEQSTSDPLFRGGIAIGQGVTVDGIVRQADALLGAAQLAQSGDASQAATLHDELRSVESVFDEVSSDGPRSAVDAFFDTLTAASSDPSDPGLRTEVARAGEQVASTITRTAAELEVRQQAMQEQVELELPPLNEKLQMVATLNQRIVAAGGEQAAADLVEQREALMRDLGEKAGFTARIEASGAATVMLDGHAVVRGEEARELVSGGGTSVKLSVDDGVVSVDPGGQLGGLIEASDTVDRWLGELDTFALDFANAVNGQNAAGFVPGGAAGGDLFTVDPANPRGSLVFTGGPDDLAFAANASAAAGDGGNLEALRQLATASVVGGETPGDFLSGLTDMVAGDVTAAGIEAENQQLSMKDLDDVASRRFGVDMDVEATNLVLYQTAYQAAARVIASADEAIGTLLELV